MVLPGANPFPKEWIGHYYQNHVWLGMTLGEMLDRSADLYPNKEALIAGDVRLTYQELRERVDRAAIAFLDLGLGKLDRVLLQLPNWAEFVYAYYGLHKVGAIPVMCLPRFSQREMEHFSEITEPKAWVVPLRYEKIDYHPMIKAIQARPTHLKHIVVIDTREGRNEPWPEGTLSFHTLLQKVDLKKYSKDTLHSLRADPDELCHLMPTGGSTGLPKLVPRTHNDFLCNFDYRAKAWERSPRDISLIATPVTHNMAIEVSMNPTFLTGGKVVMIPSTRPKEILEAIEKERVTTMILAVAQVQQIIDFSELDRYKVASLQVIATGGSHMPSELIKKVYDKLGCKFFNVFGGPAHPVRHFAPCPGQFIPVSA